MDYRINGEFDSADDVDYFSVDLTTVDDPYSCSFRVAHNGDEVKGDILLEMNYFPLNISFYDVDGYITGTQYLWAASGDGICEVPDDAVKMVVSVYGDSEIELLGTALPYTSGDYYVQFYVN
ncbi:MAG TPA: hypothetical protein DCO79_12460 [Spirochaeta sp.]|nr:hypothetical protein [Spirochaeta sp.]